MRKALSEEFAMIELSVEGMTCGHCIRVVTRAVKSVEPQATVEVDLEGGRVRVEGAKSADEVIRALGAAGYPAIRAGTHSPGGAARKGCCCSA